MQMKDVIVRPFCSTEKRISSVLNTNISYLSCSEEKESMIT